MRGDTTPCYSWDVVDIDTKAVIAVSDIESEIAQVSPEICRDLLDGQWAATGEFRRFRPHPEAAEHVAFVIHELTRPPSFTVATRDGALPSA
ncbi:hypothetical protein [Magnetospirillum molischianum]|nr:hypothetical protein [Magnetospirillum molischianum]